ncbi:MAG: histidine phosphatase family protein [Candidatus Saccharibacteria bacterium]|nr:histidine phosphatase family protein [Candidatus Saccharibacteria bacterium]
MEIVLVRHGETDWNLEGRLMGQKDVPLNERGREQAKVLRNKLADVGFDCCYSSPLSRAKETAEIICKDKCDVICDDNLKERFGGRLEGAIINNWGDYEDDKTTETDEEILERARCFLKMLEGVNAQRVLVVSHNGLLKNLRYCILGEKGKLDYSAGNFVNCDYEAYEI